MTMASSLVISSTLPSSSHQLTPPIIAGAVGTNSVENPSISPANVIIIAVSAVCACVIVAIAGAVVYFQKRQLIATTKSKIGPAAMVAFAAASAASANGIDSIAIPTSYDELPIES